MHIMVWLDYTDFILISVYMHRQRYAVHALVLISVYCYWNQYNEVNQRSLARPYTKAFLEEGERELKLAADCS